MEIDKKTQIEAAAFRKLVEHFQDRTDVQNIDIMDLAGFCRNCLSRWYQESSVELGNDISKGDAREIIYGMPYDATVVGPTILHFDPDTIGALPLGYDLYIAEDFTFPYLYVTVPDGEFPGQSFRMVVEKQADMNDQQVYLQDTEGNWLALARQYETNGQFAELVWTGERWVSSALD
mgnify:CR=1 FL=1